MNDYSILAKIAKEAILAKFEKKEMLKDNFKKQYPFLNKNGAVFVTLKKNHQLRGCAGSVIAHRSLLEDVACNAINAAFRDPRFPSLIKDELEDIEMEISILTPPKLIEYDSIDDLKSKIEKNKDGIILKYNGFQATYLPQVWEEFQNFEEFFESLGTKAGIGPNALELKPTIYKYQVNFVK